VNSRMRFVRSPPAGDVLEIASGTGNLTAALAAVDGVEHITAVDASDEALAIARTKVGDTSGVTFLQADVFDWRPAGQFGASLSGSGSRAFLRDAFESFWQLVAGALRPRGRVFFTDNAIPVELAASADGRQARTPWSRTWLDRGERGHWRMAGGSTSSRERGAPVSSSSSSRPWVGRAPSASTKGSLFTARRLARTPHNAEQERRGAHRLPEPGRTPLLELTRFGGHLILA
jgi:SAM-dependent methyltransferase